VCLQAPPEPGADRDTLSGQASDSAVPTGEKYRIHPRIVNEKEGARRAPGNGRPGYTEGVASVRVERLGETRLRTAIRFLVPASLAFAAALFALPILPSAADSPPQAGAVPTPPPPAPRPEGGARFISPHPGEIVAGATVLEVQVGGDGSGVRVQFFVDDKPAGTATAPPFRIGFDFGDSLASRTLRAIVTDAKGQSFETTLATRAMGKPDDFARVDLVNLYVTVRDDSGRFVQGLERKDFQVAESGRVQEISHFSNERQRLVVGMVLDVSLSMKGDRMEQAREAARSFMEKLEPADRALGICFNEDARLVREETSDHAAVTLALLACQPSGGTALYDAIYRAADRLAPIEGRKVVVLLSDGRDEAASGLDPGSLHTLEEALDRTLRSEVIVYAVGVGERLDEKMDFYGRRSLASILEELSAKTGGRAIFIRRAGQLHKAFDEIGEELRWQYGVAYASNDARRDGAWREVKVTVQRPRAKAATRTGYFAPRAS